MFVLAKILDLLSQPLCWVLALVLLGLLVWKHKPRAAKRLIVSAWVLLLAIGYLPLPDFLIQQLEQQSTEMSPQADLKAYVGVIVLGGATESGHLAQQHVQPLLNSAAERMTAPVAMLQHTPHLRVVFTGGEGELRGSGPSEAERARMFFDSMGLSGNKVQYESASRNTYENAVLTARLPGMDITQRWLLLTSAAHMPRSLATFNKAGWNVTAYPVDFRTGGTLRWSNYSLRDGVDHWQLVLHELLGWAAYWLTGKL
jgi:uncharacterized SAM-binding protein YcdF (DUF218 family)